MLVEEGLENEAAEDKDHSAVSPLTPHAVSKDAILHLSRLTVYRGTGCYLGVSRKGAGTVLGPIVRLQYFGVYIGVLLFSASTICI